MAMALLFIGAVLLIAAAALTGSVPLILATVGGIVLAAGVDLTRGDRR